MYIFGKHWYLDPHCTTILFRLGECVNVICNLLNCLIWSFFSSETDTDAEVEEAVKSTDIESPKITETPDIENSPKTMETSPKAIETSLNLTDEATAAEKSSTKTESSHFESEKFPETIEPNVVATEVGQIPENPELDQELKNSDKTRSEFEDQK